MAPGTVLAARFVGDEDGASELYAGFAGVMRSLARIELAADVATATRRPATNVVLVPGGRFEVAVDEAGRAQEIARLRGAARQARRRRRRAARRSSPTPASSSGLPRRSSPRSAPASPRSRPIATRSRRGWRSFAAPEAREPTCRRLAGETSGHPPERSATSIFARSPSSACGPDSSASRRCWSDSASLSGAFARSTSWAPTASRRRRATARPSCAPTVCAAAPTCRRTSPGSTNGSSSTDVPLGETAFAAAVERVRATAADLPADLGPVTQFEVLTVAAFAAPSPKRASRRPPSRPGSAAASTRPTCSMRRCRGRHLDRSRAHEVLGDTREAVFAEKAAVIKGGDAVFGPLDGLEDAARAVCRERRRARPAGRRRDRRRRRRRRVRRRRRRLVATTGSPLPTLAAYQAVERRPCRRRVSPAPRPPRRRDAARGARRRATCPVACRSSRREPLVLADGAHNPDGVRALAASLAGIDASRAARRAVLAIMRDKGVGEMLEVLCPLFDRLVCSAASEPRSLAADDLARLAGATVRRAPGRSSPSPTRARRSTRRVRLAGAAWLASS